MHPSVKILLAGLLCTSLCLAQQKPKDSVEVDPERHKVVLENEHFRVFEARASYPTSSPMHSHPPFIFISLDTARAKFTFPDGKKVLFDTYPGQALWIAEGMQHSWELLSGEVNVIGVEIKSAQKAATQPLPPVTRKANDAVTVDPDTHRVLFENDHVRVFEGRGSAGGKSVMHSHPPILLVSLQRARFKLTLPDRTTVVHDFSPGQVLWFGDGMEHSWEMLAGEAQIIAIEVKSAQRAMKPAKAD